MKTFYRKSLISFLFIFVIFLIFIVIFNYFVDAGNQFYQAAGFEKKLSKSLLNNKNVLVCANYNDRSLKRNLLENLATRPNILVLGSSRTMPVSGNLFKEYNFFNASVTSASLEDDIALYHIFSRRGWTPQVVMITLDPWLIERHVDKIKWKTIFKKEYAAAKRLLCIKPHPLENYLDRISGFSEKYSQLLSAIYLKSSLKKMSLSLNPLYNGLIDVKSSPDKIDENNFPNCYIQYPDGTRYTSKNEESTTTQQADFVSMLDVQESSHLVQINPEKQFIFESFIKYLVMQNIKVLFYLPPYEPIAYSEIQKNKEYRTINQIEKYFVTIAGKYNLHVIGSYNPNNLNLHSEDFVDYIHLKKKGIDKVFHKN